MKSHCKLNPSMDSHSKCRQDKINYEDGETFDEGFVRIRELVNFKLKKEFEKVGGM